jgi:hypothetical protein
LKKTIISLITCGLLTLFLTGCSDDSAANHSTSPAYATPGSVEWNGITYTTRDFLKKQQLGRHLGVINIKNRIKYPVYSVKGYQPSKGIAIEVHNPNKQFVVAVNKK